MTQRPTRRSRRAPTPWTGLGLAALLAAAGAPALAADYPVTPEQRGVAQKVAEAGVPLSALAPNAPDSHTVKRGDTLWGISKIFLTSPWRWPELWGMNLEQIRNPHLIYPGQVLVLEKTGDRARLRVGQAVPTSGADDAAAPSGTTRLQPRVRPQPLVDAAIAAVPLHLIAPFLDEAVVFGTDELLGAPRIVAAPENRVMMARGDLAYVRGDMRGLRDWRVFREAVPLRDPTTGQTLGYEARFVGTAEFKRDAGLFVAANGAAAEVPATIRITGIKQEVGVGDRLAPVPARDVEAFVPHAPAGPTRGQIIGVYGDAITGGQNQIVSLNRGSADGLERGHVLALWRDGAFALDRTGDKPLQIKLPDERLGLLFVFRVYDRVSYALIVTTGDSVRAGDRFTQP